MKFFIRNIIICLFCSNLLISQELIIGQERVEPGIVFIFEGAIKDIVYPDKFHLSEGKSDIHIEARVNWDKVNIPEGTPPNGFVPYLKINALVTNEKTGVKSFIDFVRIIRQSILKYLLHKTLIKFLSSPPPPTYLDKITRSLLLFSSFDISTNLGANSHIFVSTQPI